MKQIHIKAAYYIKPLAFLWLRRKICKIFIFGRLFKDKIFSLKYAYRDRQPYVIEKFYCLYILCKSR